MNRKTYDIAIEILTKINNLVDKAIYKLDTLKEKEEQKNVKK